MSLALSTLWPPRGLKAETPVTFKLRGQLTSWLIRKGLLGLTVVVYHIGNRVCQLIIAICLLRCLKLKGFTSKSKKLNSHGRKKFWHQLATQSRSGRRPPAAPSSAARRSLNADLHSITIQLLADRKASNCRIHIGLSICLL